MQLEHACTHLCTRLPRRSCARFEQLNSDNRPSHCPSSLANLHQILHDPPKAAAGSACVELLKHILYTSKLRIQRERCEHTSADDKMSDVTFIEKIARAVTTLRSAPVK